MIIIFGSIQRNQILYSTAAINISNDKMKYEAIRKVVVTVLYNEMSIYRSISRQFLEMKPH